MADNEASVKRAAAKRAAELEPPSELSKYLPYLAGLGVVGGLVLTVTRSQQYGVYAGTALLVLAMAGLGWVGWEHTATIPAGDRLRAYVGVVIAAVLLGSAGPAVLALFPPAPAAVVTLARAGDRADAEVHGTAAALVLEAEGAFVPDVGSDARAQFTLLVQRGGREEVVTGVFQRSGDDAGRQSVRASRGVASRHVLATMRGEGPLSIVLDRLPESVRPPLRVIVRAEPFSQGALAGFFASLALAALWIDVKIARRKIESAFAAAMGVVLCAVFYLHGHFTRATLPSDLLAAGLVGVLGGGVGGEIVARLARVVAPGRS